MLKKSLLKGFLLEFPSESFNVPNIVVFSINPETMTDVKGNAWVDIKVPGLPYVKYQWIGGEERSLEFTLNLNSYSEQEFLSDESNNLLNTLNLGILPYINSLKRFVYPQISLNNFLNEDHFTKPPRAILGWGTTIIDVIVKNIKFTYQAFNENLIPIRGTADVSLVEIENTPLNKAQKILNFVTSTIRTGMVSSSQIFNNIKR